MIFMAQGTPVSSILNDKYVSVGILNSTVESFNLVKIGLFTALASKNFLTKVKK